MQKINQMQESDVLISHPGKGSPWKEKIDYKSRSFSLVSRDFDATFFAGLQVSENFMHTYSKAYSLNHPDQKRANYLLLERKDGKLIPTILAGYDYHNYKQEKKL